MNVRKWQKELTEISYKRNLIDSAGQSVSSRLEQSVFIFRFILTCERTQKKIYKIRLSRVKAQQTEVKLKLVCGCFVSSDTKVFVLISIIKWNCGWTSEREE